MASPILTQILGTTRSRKITGRSGGQPLTGVFVGGDVLSATVSSGESQAALLAPVVTWIDASAGTIKFTVTAAQLLAAGVTPGVYTVTVTVTPLSDSQPRAVYRGQIRFEPNVGVESAFTSWVSFDDMANWSSQVSSLQDRDEDLAQFARQRNYAMTQHVALIVRKYSPALGGSFRYVDAAGTGAGPYLRRSGSPDSSPPPTRGQVRDWLLTPGRIILNEDVIEANALLAASMVYGGQPGSSSPYAQLAEKEYSRAMRAMERAFVEIDTQTVPDGTPIIRVHRDVTYLT